MEIVKDLSDLNVNLVDFLYTLVDFEYDPEDSNCKQKHKDKCEQIIYKISDILERYRNNIESLNSVKSQIQYHDDICTVSTECNYTILFKEASERLLDYENIHDFKEPLVNGMAIFLQYLSPKDINWHYHRNKEGSEVKFCCKFGEISLNDLEIHYHIVLVSYVVVINFRLYSYHCVNFVDTIAIKVLIVNQMMNLGNLFNSSKGLQSVVMKINGIISIIYLNLNNNLSKTTEFHFSLELNVKPFECTQEDFKNIDLDMYNKSRSRYNLFPTPCKLALLGSRIITKCYMNLLILLANSSFNFYNSIISTLLIIYNNTLGLILDDIYDLLIYLSNNHTKAFSEGPNLLLLKEVVNKMDGDINNYNSSVSKCVECFILLTSMVYNDKDVKIYEVLESLTDRLNLMNESELKRIFMKMYNKYLKKVPLACAATMLQTMEIIFGSMDLFEVNNILTSINCLEDIFHHLPNDGIYYFPDIYFRFLFLYVRLWEDKDKLEDSLNDLQGLRFLSKLIVKVTIISNFKKDFDLDRYQVVKSMENVIKTVKNECKSLDFDEMVTKINYEIMNDRKITDHTVDLIKNFSNEVGF